MCNNIEIGIIFILYFLSNIGELLVFIYFIF